jgi:Tfp pilus assembly protein PilX
VVLAHSAEHYAYQIENIYQQYLGRGADTGGQQFWVAAMQHGMTQEQLEADFIGSAEYIADHGGRGAGWVSGMYENLLGRTPDSSGLNFWVEHLASGANPVSVALGFAASAEREASKIASDYQALLGRAPDASEVDNWVNAFEHGVTNDDVMADFVGSSEFLQQHEGNLIQFIDAAYQQLLGRSATSSELEYWYNFLHRHTHESDADRLTVTAPSTATAGTSFTLTVTATDDDGNIATGYTGTVRFGSNDAQAGLPDSYTFTAADAGVHTFTVTLKTAGKEAISVRDTQDHLLGYAHVAVTPAAASTLTIYERAATVGVSHYVYVIAKDAYGNTATGYDGTVHFTSSDSQAVLPPDGALKHGLGYFRVTMMSPGPQTITVTDTSDSSLTTTVNVIYKPTPPSVAPASISISGPSSATAGTAQSYTVSVLDAHGNVLTNFTGTVHFTSTDGQAVLPADYTFTGADAGVHTFSATLKTAGSKQISVTDTQDQVVGNASVTVTPASASAFAISEKPAVVGVSHPLYVTAIDAYGNTVTTYTGTVHFASSDSQAILPPDSALTNGTGSFPVTMGSAGPQSITVTDTSNSSLTTTVNVLYVPT